MAATRQRAQPVAALGAVAQLGERLVRNEEVRGSIPLGSTTPNLDALEAPPWSLSCSPAGIRCAPVG
jgi:hypothetical protein